MVLQAHMTMQEFIALVEDNPEKHFDFNAAGEVIETAHTRRPSWIQVQVAHILMLFFEGGTLPGYEVLTECAHELNGWPCRPDVSVDAVGESEIPTMAPLLAVEIKSDSNSLKDLRAKARRYLEHGTAMVWLIFPERRFIEVYQAGADDQILFAEDRLDGSTVLPGFSVMVADLLYPEQTKYYRKIQSGPNTAIIQLDLGRSTADECGST